MLLPAILSISIVGIPFLFVSLWYYFSAQSKQEVQYQNVNCRENQPDQHIPQTLAKESQSDNEKQFIDIQAENLKDQIHKKTEKEIEADNKSEESKIEMVQAQTVKQNLSINLKEDEESSKYDEIIVHNQNDTNQSNKRQASMQIRAGQGDQQINIAHFCLDNANNQQQNQVTVLADSTNKNLNPEEENHDKKTENRQVLVKEPTKHGKNSANTPINSDEDKKQKFDQTPENIENQQQGPNFKSSIGPNAQDQHYVGTTTGKNYHQFKPKTNVTKQKQDEDKNNNLEQYNRLQNIFLIISCIIFLSSIIGRVYVTENKKKIEFPQIMYLSAINAGCCILLYNCFYTGILSLLTLRFSKKGLIIGRFIFVFYGLIMTFPIYSGLDEFITLDFITSIIAIIYSVIIQYGVMKIRPIKSWPTHIAFESIK